MSYSLQEFSILKHNELRTPLGKILIYLCLQAFPPNTSVVSTRRNSPSSDLTNLQFTVLCGENVAAFSAHPNT